MLNAAGPLTGSSGVGGRETDMELELELDRQQQQCFQQQQERNNGLSSTTNPLIPFLASTGATSSSDFVNPGGMQGGELGRATLMQMSEMSRRAAAGAAGGLASWAGEQLQSRARDGERGEYPREGVRKRESMDLDVGQQRWFENGSSSTTNSAANNNAAGSSSSSSGPSNNSTSSSSSNARHNGLMNINLSGLQGMQGLGGLGELGGLMMMGENAEASAMHEGLQVYTVGHLMPRGSYQEEEIYNAPSASARASGSGGGRDTNANAGGDGPWSFDTSGLAAGGMLGGLGITQAQQQRYEEQRQAQQQRQGRSSDEEDEMVQPSINTTDENGDLVVQNSSNSPASGSSPRTSQASASSSSAHARRDFGNDEPISISTPGVLAHSRQTNSATGSTTDGKPTIRVRRSTFVPGWAVPPRVLLVDDDAVSRKLSSKFLQVFGCTTDIAVDGVGAVNKMNLEKYDLVLMVCIHRQLGRVRRMPADACRRTL